jgi:xenotropic and polytropic retrovirus receptor 1
MTLQLAKKKLKTVSRSLHEFNRTPNTPSFRTPVYNQHISSTEVFNDRQIQADERNSEEDVPPESDEHHKYDISARQKFSRLTVPTHRAEREPLVREHRSEVPTLMIYGSIIGSPPKEPSKLPRDRPPSIRLPEPAISSGRSAKKGKKIVKIRDNGPTGVGISAYEAGKTQSPVQDRTVSRAWRIFQPGAVKRSPLRRLLSIGQRSHSSDPLPDCQMDVYRGLESAQNEFFGFLDEEFEKIEDFYKEKEDEASRRLMVLRDQLHILRDRRLDDLIKSRRDESKSRHESTYSHGINHLDSSDSDELETVKKISWLAPLDRAWTRAINGRVGRKSVAMEAEGTPEVFRPHENSRDYVRRKTDTVTPYRTAKRKLKLAMQEYYRSLELLKSYAILNRTAFRKINKKYDKVTNSHPRLRYMSEKINLAWFVKSDVLDSHIQTVEDLYARYFEAGNHKLAANKLRKASKLQDYHGGAMFRNGIYLGAGAGFGGLGIEAAYKLLSSNNPDIATQTGYLLQVRMALLTKSKTKRDQIYGGYLLMLLLMLLFCLACQFWTRSKVNYVFIFEFDLRDHLDWRQLLEVIS